MHTDSLPDSGLFLFQPPYDDYQPVRLGWSPKELLPGASAVWFMASQGNVVGELQWLRTRPSWLPLFIVLPPADDLHSLASVLKDLRDLQARAVIPTTYRGLAPALQTLLALPPANLPKAAVNHLQKIERIPDTQAKEVIEEIFSIAPRVGSIKGLAASMCRSRRTLGRFFQARGLPVPSHWLQFARILHVTLHIQN